MQLRILFFLLIFGIFVCLCGMLSYMTFGYFDVKKVPSEPCASVIHNGQFIDESLKSYQFKGVITWWPKFSRLTLFGIRSDTSGDKVFNRSLVLKDSIRKHNVVQGRVAELSIATGDQLPKNMFLISGEHRDMTLLFKPINHRSWLVMVNDNWVMICDYK